MKFNMYNKGDIVIERIGPLSSGNSEQVMITRADDKYVYTPRGFKYTQDTGKGDNGILGYNVILHAAYVGVR